MTRVFRLFLDSKLSQTLVLNNGRMVGPCGTWSASGRFSLFLHGLHGARRTRAFQPMQKQHGTRDEGNTTHTPQANNRKVVFRCHLFLSLAVSISSINSYLQRWKDPPPPLHNVIVKKKLCTTLCNVEPTTRCRQVLISEPCQLSLTENIANMLCKVSHPTRCPNLYCNGPRQYCRRRDAARTLRNLWHPARCPQT